MEQSTYQNNLEILCNEITGRRTEDAASYRQAAIDLFEEVSTNSKIECRNYTNTAELLFNNLSPEIKKYKQEREEFNKQCSGDFNIFSMLGRGYNENVFSDIIADMLDPEGSHGQKMIFLEAFLDRIQNKNVKKREIKNRHIEFIRKIRREEGTEENRRIDIYMEFHDGFLLVIENKIDAGDQPKQVEHYISEIRSRKGGNRNDFYFIYLSPDGHNPDTNSIKKEEREQLEEEGLFTTMSYKEDINKWLDECIDKCASGRFSYFMEDMKATILQW